MSSMSRATLRKTKSDEPWNELDVDVLKGETATGVEWVENYGTTSHPAKQDVKDKGQKKQQAAGGGASGGGPGGAGGGSAGIVGEQPEGPSAEPIIGYMNGSRSHPVVLAVGDRRHRLQGLEEGDVAQHRLKDDRQQVLLSKDGTYVSTREDKKFRAALVPKEAKDQQQAQQPTRGGGQAQQAQQGGDQKEKGQKSAKEDNTKSQVAIEQNGTQTFSQHGEFYTAQKSGSDASVYHKDRKVSSQATEDHVHMRFKDDAKIWVDKDGHWSEAPILQKKDKHCKE